MNTSSSDDCRSDPPQRSNPSNVNVSEGRFVKRLLIVLLVVAVSAICILAFRLLCVVFAGLLLGVFLYRISDAIQHRTPLSYRVSFAVAIVTLVGLISSLGFLLVPRLGAQLSDLSTTLSSSIQGLLARMSEWGWVESVADQAPQVGSDVLSTLDAAAFLGGAFSSVLSAITAVFFILFLGFFLAIEPDLYRRGFLSLVPPRHRQRANSLLRATVDTLWWWTMGRLLAMTIVGLATAVGLFLLGIPLAFTLGALAGIVSFVPTIGAVLAIVPALLVAFEQDAFSPVYVLILYVGIQVIENNLITPIVQQKAVSVPPVVLIISQVLMGLLVGIVGIAIATPLAAVGIELVRELYVKDESPGERQLNAGPTE